MRNVRGTHESKHMTQRDEQLQAHLQIKALNSIFEVGGVLENTSAEVCHLAKYAKLLSAFTFHLSQSGRG